MQQTTMAVAYSLLTVDGRAGQEDEVRWQHLTDATNVGAHHLQSEKGGI